jgi:tetratricopeptide (TPR) repeat protein
VSELSTPPQQPVTPVRRGRWIVWICVAAAIALALWSQRSRWKTAFHRPAEPPAVDLHDYDPQVASLIERATAAVRAAPRSSAAWGTLGAALMTHKLHREALVCLAEAEKLNPAEPRWPYLQGVVLLSWDPDAAIPKLERGAELAGDAPPAPRLRLANALIERGRLDEADAHVSRILRAHPAEPYALLDKGKLEFARGHLEAALAALERCVESPQTAHAASGLIAAVERRLGHPEKAAAAAQRLATLPRDAGMPDPFVAETGALQTGMQTWLTQADLLLKSGRVTEALALNEKTVATYPHDAVAWQMLGQARIEAKDYARAEQALGKAVELAPNSAESHFQLGSAHFLAGHAADAVTAFRRSVALRPNYAPGHYNLGLCLQNQGDQAGSIEEFRTAIQLDPGFADAHRQLGSALALERRFTESIPPLTRAIELNPKDSAAVQMLERATLRAAEEK